MTAPDDTDRGQARPISTAPEVVDAPLLLWARGAWCLGYWDGKGWCNEAGFYISPTAWAPLPAPPVSS